jgi:hypothetical protein
MTPLAFVPFGAIVRLSCGCLAYRLAAGPNGSVGLGIIRSCPEHPKRDEIRYASPSELVGPYDVAQA